MHALYTLTASIKLGLYPFGSIYFVTTTDLLALDNQISRDLIGSRLDEEQHRDHSKHHQTKRHATILSQPETQSQGG